MSYIRHGDRAFGLPRQIIETSYPKLGPCKRCGVEIMKAAPNQVCKGCRRKK